MYCKAFETLIGTVCMLLYTNVHLIWLTFSFYWIAVYLKVLILECFHFFYTIGSLHYDGCMMVQLGCC